MEVDKSSLVVSKAGRDQGQLFYVIDADEQYVYLTPFWHTFPASSG